MKWRAIHSGLVSRCCMDTLARIRRMEGLCRVVTWTWYLVYEAGDVECC